MCGDFFSGPDEEDIIDVAPPNQWSTGGRVKHLFFQLGHEQAGKGRGHTSSHGGAEYLQEMLIHEFEVILGENMGHESFEI